tara:strand:+ start:54 stop:818 length:765 start_codon:yes stop_codon:yes gene_type:complete
MIKILKEELIKLLKKIKQQLVGIMSVACILFTTLHFINRDVTLVFFILGLVAHILFIFLIIKRLNSKLWTIVLLSMVTFIIATSISYGSFYYKSIGSYTKMTKFNEYKKYYDVILENCLGVNCNQNIPRFHGIVKPYYLNKKDCIYNNSLNCNNKTIYLEPSIFYLFESSSKYTLFSLEDKLSILELLTRDIYIISKDNQKIPYLSTYLKVITSLYILYLQNYDKSNIGRKHVITLKVIQDRLNYLKKINKNKT